MIIHHQQQPRHPIPGPPRSTAAQLPALCLQNCSAGAAPSLAIHATAIQPLPTLAGAGASPSAATGRGASATYASMEVRKSGGGLDSLGSCIDCLICGGTGPAGGASRQNSGNITATAQRFCIRTRVLAGGALRALPHSGLTRRSATNNAHPPRRSARWWRSSRRARRRRPCSPCTAPGPWLLRADAGEASSGQRQAQGRCGRCNRVH